MVMVTNVPEGYKQTKVGLIPNDWQEKRLEDVSKLSSGTTPSRKLEERYYLNGNIYWVKTTDLNNSNIIHTEEKITELALNETCLKEYSIGTVLVAMYGGFNQIGRTGLLKIPAAVNQALIAIQPQSETLDSIFIINYLNFRVSYWKSVAISSRKDPNLTSRNVKEFPIPLPPLSEQKAIAQALRDADAAIAELDRLITKKRNIKQGTMQQLLTGKKRLPGFSGEWGVQKLGSCLIKNPEYGINASAVPYSDNLPVYIRITDISDDGKFLRAQKVSVNHPQSANYLLETNDLVLARTGASTGKSYLYNPQDGELIFAGFLIKVKVNPQKLDARYLKGFLQTKAYWNWVTAMSMRSGQPGINGNEYAQLPISLPPTLEEQSAIAQVLTDMDAEIEALEQKRDKYKAIKQGMMQELLTGRTRLV